MILLYSFGLGIALDIALGPEVTLEPSPNCNKNKDCYCISSFPAIEVILSTTQYFYPLRVNFYDIW